MPPCNPTSPAKQAASQSDALALVLDRVSDRDQLARLPIGLERLRHCVLADTSMPDFLDRCVRTVGLTLGIPLCKVLELDRSGAWLHGRAGMGWDTPALANASITTNSTSHAGLAFRMGTPVIISDLARIPHLREASLLRRHAVVSGMATRIGTAVEPFGVLSAHTTTRREFASTEIQFFQRAAVMIDAGIRRRRAEHTTRCGAVAAPTRLQ